jgi:ubiquinol-cytochrome c reductase cytochrome b subunit
MSGAIVNLNHPAHTVHWSFFQMSVANLVVLIVMLVVFALSIALPLPGKLKSLGGAGPRRQADSVTSWTYVLGSAAIAALAVIVASGLIIGLKGPAWWHDSGAGHFFNSIHMWAAELLFLFTVVHLWVKYWTAAWRGGRIGVWVTGAVGFLLTIPTALTGYLSQQNFDAQWIAAEAKDGLNSIGAGAFFNVANFGQMYNYHVLILPFALAVLVIAHVRLIRRHGLVSPFASRTPPKSTPVLAQEDQRVLEQSR